MKKKNLIILIVFLVIIIGVGVIIYLNYNKTDKIQNQQLVSNIENKQEKGKELFGQEYCENDGLHPATFDLVRYKCVICQKQFEGSGSRKAVSVCDECATQTNRCTICGKLLK